MNDELGSIRKEVVVTWSRYHLEIILTNCGKQNTSLEVPSALNEIEIRCAISSPYRFTKSWGFRIGGWSHIDWYQRFKGRRCFHYQCGMRNFSINPHDILNQRTIIWYALEPRYDTLSWKKGILNWVKSVLWLTQPSEQSFVSRHVLYF
jgi:hypothetical protein